MDNLSAQTASPPGDITRLLIAWSEGDAQALDAILPLAFDDLRRIAGKCFRRLPMSGMQATELVGEIYEDLHAQRKVSWQCRGQFYKFASRLMERVLMEYWRSAHAKKRGGDVDLVPLDETLERVVSQTVSLQAPARGLDDGQAEPMEAAAGLHQTIDVFETIQQLESLDPLQANIVRMRYYMGLTLDETAEALEVSRSTVQRGWRRGRDFLSMELGDYEMGETQAET